MKKFLVLLLSLLLVLFALPVQAESAVIPPVAYPDESILTEDGYILTEDELEIEYGCVYLDSTSVALYLHVFAELPVNYLTKESAQDAGWNNSKGNLWDVVEYGCIGGNRFGNREGILPNVKGRVWYEADVNYTGGYRGSERLLFSSDGLIYYTGDHYTTAQPVYDGWYYDDIAYVPAEG